jgi:signal transduction histidine kinase
VHNLNQRVLFLATDEKDKDSIGSLFSDFMTLEVLSNASELISEIDKGVGALLLTKDSLAHEDVSKLAEALNRQPSWSHIPLVILIDGKDFNIKNQSTLNLLRSLRNATFLERPVQMNSLVSVVQSALADRKRQFEAQDLMKSVEASKKEAIESSEAKSNFLANMSHEIRTPLGAILGYSELLGEQNITSEQRNFYIETVRRNGNLLLSLVDDILDLSKVESGQFEVDAVEVSLKEMVSEIISALEPRASSKKLRLMISYDSFQTDLIKTDVIRLKQILMNIVGNAIKFTQQGMIHLKIGTKSVDDDFSKLNLYIDVTDTGIGITPEQAQTLFKPFTQADNSTTRKFGGTGLGLVLSKKLAQAMGGDLILCKSELGKGSTFRITTQVEKVEHKEAEYNTSNDITAEQRAALPLYKLKILVVDDSQDNQFLISHLLRMQGADVETADDGLMGIEKATSENYEIVLMDMQMPRLGGLEATSELRRQKYFKPIVALTANALKGDRERCFSAGCDGYLTKPIQRHELIQTICDISRRPF